ncbi:unnamed protein product [Parnassius apollo]|uniref:(apollo) hypothetical protein n=1 Tax=Parnassius apollo TaxID=110799 RepID=A0A8S3WC47_PARAO|nr:unnamed protein product [Parnassius apollo]
MVLMDLTKGLLDNGFTYYTENYYYRLQTKKYKDRFGGNIESKQKTYIQGSYWKDTEEKKDSVHGDR